MRQGMDSIDIKSLAIKSLSRKELLLYLLTQKDPCSSIPDCKYCPYRRESCDTMIQHPHKMHERLVSDLLKLDVPEHEIANHMMEYLL